MAGSVPAVSAEGHAIATFAGGCFWGIELRFARVPGVVATGTGYTQGHVKEPSYQEVCSGSTGHTEAIQIFYDPKEVAYEELLKVFWERIDPLMENGQGGDRGEEGGREGRVGGRGGVGGKEGSLKGWRRVCM